MKIPDPETQEVTLLASGSGGIASVTVRIPTSVVEAPVLGESFSGRIVAVSKRVTERLEDL